MDIVLLTLRSKLLQLCMKLMDTEPLDVKVVPENIVGFIAMPLYCITVPDVTFTNYAFTSAM